MTTATKARTTTNTTPLLIGFAVLVLIGIAAWAIQLTQGMSVIGTGQSVVWGVYIVSFFLLAGLAGGLVILAAGADLEVVPGLKPYRRGLLLGALACFIASGFMILMDIGQPFRVLNMVFSPNLSSPFEWDFGCLALGVVVAAIYLYVGPQGKLLPVLAALVAALVVVVEGWILSMSAGSPLWHGGMMPAIFFVEALVAASALTLITQSNRDAGRWLVRALLVLLPILVALNLFELAAVNYAGEPEAQAAASLLLTGNLALFFWGELLLGIVIPFALLAWFGRDRTMVLTAAVLAILGVFVAKYVVLVAGQAIPFMQSPVAYTPTWVEAAGVIGMAGFAGLLYLLADRFLPAKAQ